MFPATPPALPGVEHLDVTVGRARWHVAVAGPAGGPPVVLLHGWPQHWWAWREVIPRLAREHRVYAPDLRGFGWSDAPEGRYGKAGLAADLNLLLDELQVGRCALAGHDWGGLVAFLAALRQPERFERIAAFGIVHPWPRPAGITELRSLLAGAYMPALAAPVLGAELQRRVPRLVATLLAASSAPGFRWDPDAVRLYEAALRRPAHARAASALYRTFLTRELPAMLRGAYANRTLRVPAVLATGRHDPVVTPRRIEGAGDRAPLMRTEVVDGAGHWLPEEASDRVSDLIAAA